MPSKGKILAIDYGTKKIGLAVSDDARLLAFGRGVVDASKGFKYVVQCLEKLCADEHIEDILLGIPLDDEGEEGESALRVRNFSQKLALQLPGKQLHFFDESFSSFEAQKLLKESGKNGFDDEMAAVVTLQRYLDTL